MAKSDFDKIQNMLFGYHSVLYRFRELFTEEDWDQASVHFGEKTNLENGDIRRLMDAVAACEKE